MRPIHLALVSEVRDHDPVDIAAVTAAIQKQLLRDFGPAWGITASIVAFPKLEDVPADYWPVIVRDDFDFAALGLHLTVHDQPYALIRYTDTWSLAVSHEVLELCADHTGARTAAGRSITGDSDLVEYLMEICDPPEAKEFAYSIDGVLVSDFCLPSFFDAEPAPGVRYSFTGAATRPLEVLPGGYISWQDPRTGVWSQHRRFGDDQGIKPLGRLDEGTTSIRSEVDRRTPHAELEQGLPCDCDELKSALAARERVRRKARLRAAELRAEMARLRRTGANPAG